MRFTAACAALVCAGLLASCSLSDPEIGDIRTYAVYEQQEDGKTAAMLSVFFWYKDEDGDRDFSHMDVQSESDGYTWTVDETSVFVNQSDGHTWVGYSRLLPPVGRQISAGLYTLTVYDHADNADVQTFELSEDDVSLAQSITNGTFSIPAELTIDFESNTWSSNSTWQTRQFVFFDDHAIPVGVYTPSNKRGRLDSLRAKASTAQSARFYVINDTQKIAYALKPFQLYPKEP